MSDGFKVKVPIYCERTRKTRDETMSLTEARAHEQAVENKRETGKEIYNFLQGLPKDQVPDLVVMYRGTAVVLNQVSTNTEATMMRLLNDLTGSEKFPKPTPKKKRKIGSDNGKSSRTTSSSDKPPGD